MNNNMFTNQAAKKCRTTEAIAALFLLLWAVVVLGNLFECADKTAEIQGARECGINGLK